MPPVFGHGRLRLYLLKLLDEAPRHGYEVIRLLEERFRGRYAPSAGTVYPRLAKLESEDLVRHTTEGGRKVYAITAAGRRELTARQAELAELEAEIHRSLDALATEEPRPGDRHGMPRLARDPAPLRELERLLDHFRDEIRDTARDHGLTPTRLTRTRTHLTTTATHLTALLRGEGE